MIWLSPLELLYRLVVYVRNALYDLMIIRQNKLDGIVISVGNISLGGTGKSPVVKDIASRLETAGARPVILTRGYKSGLQTHEWQVLLNGIVVAGVSRNDVIADEAMMQSLALPTTYVVIGARRFNAAKMFLSVVAGASPTHWILDDGFQHRSIYRDHDLVILDARQPWGQCIPLGRFREPKSSLKRATTVIISKAQTKEQVMKVRDTLRQINPSCDVQEVRFFQDPIRLVSNASSRRVDSYALVCGVASPDDVLQELKSQNLSIKKVFINPDHGRVDPEKISVNGEFQGIVTTEKDWARDRSRLSSLGIPIFVVPLRLEWVGDFSPEYMLKNPKKTNG